MELSHVMRTTPAARSFRSEPVEDALLYEILDDARFAPSGGNRQPWRVVVLKDAALRAEMRRAYVVSWREYSAHLEAGKIPFAPIDDGNWRAPAVDLEKARATPAPNDFADHLDEVPVMLLLLAQLASLAVLDNGLDRQSIVGGASVYPFSHNILLAARQRGLGGVMTTVICRAEKKVKELVGAGPELAVAGLLLLGHPTRQPTKLSRRQVEEFATVDTVNGGRFDPR